MLRERTVLTIDADTGTPRASVLSTSATVIRRLLRATRPLEPEDVDAARLAGERDAEALEGASRTRPRGARHPVHEDG